MKRKMIAILLVSCVFLTACGTSAQTPTAEAPMESAQQPEEQTSDSPATSIADVEEEVSHEITYQGIKFYTNSIGTVWGQAIVEIENTGNNPLYLSSASYDVETADGNLVASRKMVSIYPNIIRPGEKAYMYEETVYDDIDVDGEYEILPRYTADILKVDDVRLDVTDVSIKDDPYYSIRMMGRVVNNNDVPAESMIYVAAVLYDESDLPIGVISTVLTEDLAVGDKIGFEMWGISLPENVSVESVSHYNVYAYEYAMQF